MASRYFKLIFLVVSLFLSACRNDHGMAYLNRMGMEREKFNSFVIVLDYGCHTCKDQFYIFVLEAFPENCGLVFKRYPDKIIGVKYPELFSKSFVFIDSLDFSYEMGVTDKNTELALWKNGKVETFSFLEYEKLIKALESNPTDVEN